MELNEGIRRILGGHWKLVSVVLVCPLLVILALHGSTDQNYVAESRIQASSTPPNTDTEADAVLNRVKGFVTSPLAVEEAMRTVPPRDRTASGEVIPNIGVRRLGNSAVLDITVTDPKPANAIAIAGALATQSVNFINGPRTAAQINDMDNRRAQLMALTQRQGATQEDVNQKIVEVDRQIGELVSSVRDGALIEDPSGGAVLISRPQVAVPEPSTLLPDLGLAIVLGAVASLLLATLAEMLWPRVAVPSSFARELGVPHLGSLRRHHARRGPDPVLGEAVVAIRRAALRAGVDDVVLVGQGRAERLHAIAAQLSDVEASSRSAATSVRAIRVPADTMVATGPSNGDELSHTNGGLQAYPLADVDVSSSESLSRPRGLIAVVPKYAPHVEVERVRSLASSTGWPLLGVLADPRRDSKRRSD